MQKLVVFFFCFLFLSQLTKAQYLEPGVYEIISAVNDGYCIGLNQGQTYDGNKIHLWNRNGSNDQRWDVAWYNGAIILCCVNNTNYALDLNNRETTNGNKVHCWNVNYTTAQLWYPEYSNGYWILRNAGNKNYVLDLNQSIAKDDGKIQVWEYNGTNAQKWKFRKVSNGSSPSNNNGGTVIVNPYQPTPHQERCGVCGGTGTCWNCHGTGVSVHASGIRANCGACNGGGKCTNCYGLGYKTVTY